MSKATIVIPNINGKGWLKDSIESIYAQTEQDFDLIVVDNGSTDESLEQARSYCTRPNFTLIENGRNTGFSYAVNQGIARAQSKYVVLFNNDAFAEPQWLAELLRTADADPKIFAVQSLMIRHFERELADDAGDYVTWMGFACKTGDGRRVSRYTKQKRIFSACGGAALYRKSILDEIGGFDEHFFAYFEDVDLSWRANNAGYKNVLCPAAKCYHICGASTGAVRYNAFKSQQSGRNSILLPLKNEPLLMLVLNFIPLALGYLLKCYKFHKQGFGEAWDKGMHEAFALLKAGKLGKRPFRLKDLPNYILMELWMIWNMVPYLWYRLGVVRFDLKKNVQKTPDCESKRTVGCFHLHFTLRYWRHPQRRGLLPRRCQRPFLPALPAAQPRQQPNLPQQSLRQWPEWRPAHRFPPWAPTARPQSLRRFRVSSRSRSGRSDTSCRSGARTGSPYIWWGCPRRD